MVDVADLQSQTTAAIGKFKTHMNARATKPPRTPEESLRTLRGVKKPLMLVFVMLGIFAIGLDLLDLVETGGSVTVILFFLQAFLELAFFLLVRSLLNRGILTSTVLLSCFLFALVISAIPLLGTILAAVAAIPIVFLGLVNKNIKVIDVSREDVQQYISTIEDRIRLGQQVATQLTRSIAVSRQVTAKLIRAGRASRRFAGATRAIARSGALKKLTKGTRTVRRFFVMMAAEVIPVVEFLPLHVIGIALTYRDQLRIYNEAQELLGEYQRAYANLTGLDEAIVQQELAGLTARVQAWHASRTAQRIPQQPQALDSARAVPAGDTSPTPAQPVPGFRDIVPTAPQPNPSKPVTIPQEPAPVPG